MKKKVLSPYNSEGFTALLESFYFNRLKLLGFRSDSHWDKYLMYSHFIADFRSYITIIEILKIRGFA